MRRGLAFARAAAPPLQTELVALCDVRREPLERAGARLGVPTYRDYAAFLEQPMDAVVLGNFFHQHAPLAIRALRAGRHVLSETTACKTLAEGVALIRAVEESGLVYMLAENYPYTAANQEMARLYRAGAVGQFRYGEGEYVHPMSADAYNRLSPGRDHWRNWIPATYYCTHALAPLMCITDTLPVTVNGFVVPYDHEDVNARRTVARSDAASMIALRMDNGALAKLLQFGLRGEGNWVRVHGNGGLMETLRHGDRRWLRLRRERFDKAPGEPEEQTYLPDFPVHHEAAARSGHHGGDFFVSYLFEQAVRRGEQPYLNVYRAVAMSAVGILAYRSALADGVPLRLPDLRDHAERARCAGDDWSPDPADRRLGQPWPSVLGDLPPGPEALEAARRLWREG